MTGFEITVAARAAAPLAWLIDSAIDFGRVGQAGQEDPVAGEVQRPELHVGLEEEPVAR